MKTLYQCTSITDQNDVVYYIDRQQAYLYSAETQAAIEEVKGIELADDIFYLVHPSDFVMPKADANRNDYEYQVKKGSRYYGGDIFCSLSSVKDLPDGNYDVYIEEDVRGDNDYSAGTSTYILSLEKPQYCRYGEKRAKLHVDAQHYVIYALIGSYENKPPTIDENRKVYPIDGAQQSDQNIQGDKTSGLYFQAKSIQSPPQPQWQLEEALSAAVQAQLMSIHERPRTFSQEVDSQLPNISDEEEKILLEKGFVDPITMDVINKPVSLNGKTYELDSLLTKTKLLSDGSREDPFNRFPFVLQNIAPVYNYVENFTNTLNQIQSDRQKNHEQANDNASRRCVI